VAAGAGFTVPSSAGKGNVYFRDSNGVRMVGETAAGLETGGARAGREAGMCVAPRTQRALLLGYLHIHGVNCAPEQPKCVMFCPSASQKASQNNNTKYA
jgi:hypothetical protein